MSAVGAVPIWYCGSMRKLPSACSLSRLPPACVAKQVFGDASPGREPASAPGTTIVLEVPDEISEKPDQQALRPQARVSHEVVRTMKDLYGRGPTHAKTYLCDEYVFCVMSGGMTRDEETMIRGGEQDAVRDYRLRFQSVIAPELIRRVEEALERKIVSYHSQVLFDPDRLVEIFVLDAADGEATHGGQA